MEDQIIRVLLVEDSDTEAKVITECLKVSRLGRFEVVLVDRMSIAIEFLKKDMFDVVVLDLTLPDSQGPDTFLTIAPIARKAGVVVLTSNDDETLAIAALKSGVQDYQLKGQVNEKEFPRVVLYAFERKTLYNELCKNTEELELQAWGMAKTNQGIRALYHELEKKNEQIERRSRELKVFNDLSVGREERILELKGEVKKLKQELESYKRI
jgi:DNA-binding response OmpR family regulator